MKLHARGFTSLLLMLAFVVLCASGAALYASPKGRVAYWTDWTLVGLNKDAWESLHTNTAILLLLAAGIHLYLNWTIFLGYIKKRATWALRLKRELLIATSITACVVAGSVLAVPPFSTTMQVHSRIQAYWEGSAPKAPTPHAEEFTLHRLARTIGLSVEEVEQSLEEGGFPVDDRSVSLRELALQARVAPSDVYAAITKRYEDLRKNQCGLPGGPCKRAE
ncbi:MAG: DUF4405 domain-containing protein [Planctomycetaceae bacterium]|nr:DUF4405 domain-containing protein [Planctomycetaceae bacterium]